MLDGLLIALVAIAALSCPAMMLLGRRGIGSGCAMTGCKPRRDRETLDTLRAQHGKLSARIAEIEQPAQPPWM